MRFALLITITLLLIVFLSLSSPAMAQWPSGALGDQYAALNAVMAAIAAEEGISPETFIAIYNAAATDQLFAENPSVDNRRIAAAFPFRTVLAALSGPMANQFTEEEVNAACRVLSQLTPYKSLLDDYDKVYGNLSCSVRITAAAPTRGALPKTGLAVILLAGASGALGTAAAWRMFRKSKTQT